MAVAGVRWFVWFAAEVVECSALPGSWSFAPVAGSTVVSSVGWGETWAVVSVALFGGHLQETGLATRQGSFGRVVPSASLPGRAEDGRLPCGG